MADGKLIIETELGTKSFEAQYKQLESELTAKQKKLSNLLKIQQKGNFVDKTQLEKLESDIERLSNKMLDIKLRVKDTGDESEDTGKKFDFNFKKMGNTVKKFALALISVRSAYALASRASSAYLSQDIELAQKLKSVWIGLGSFLAPVLEFISNSLLKALGYLNVFIKALTGIDFLARANAKALKAQASAQKELNNQTYDFDVIRRQQDTTSAGGGGGLDDNGLFDIPELDEKIVRKLQDLAHWLKENWNWIKLVGEALIAVFGAVAIGKLLKSIAGLLGMEGLGGLNTILSTIAGIGIIAIGVDIAYYALTGRDLVQDLKDIKKGFEELKEAEENATKAEENHTKVLGNLMEKMEEDIEKNQQTSEQRDITTQSLKNQTDAIENQLIILEDNIALLDADRETEGKLATELENIIDIYDALYNQNKLTDEETEEYMDTIVDLIFVKKRLGKDTEDLEKKYEDLRIQTGKDKDENYKLRDSAQAIEDKYKELTGKYWQVNLNADTGKAEHNVTGFVRWLSSLVEKPFEFLIGAKTDISRTNSSGGGSSGFGHGGGGRAYAVGGIVTQPTRALIGEAGYPEAVVPMEQNYLSTLAQEIARYGGGSGGTQSINLYVDGRLIQRQTANRQKQRNFITNK